MTRQQMVVIIALIQSFFFTPEGLSLGPHICYRILWVLGTVLLWTFAEFILAFINMVQDIERIAREGKKK